MNFFLLAFSVACARARADLVTPGFSNPVYSAYGYQGSRLLESDYVKNPFADVLWTQTASVDIHGGIYMADSNRHAIIFVNATQKYRSFPSEGSVIAGDSTRSGYRDGTLSTSLLNSPKGVAYFETAANKYLFVSDTGNHCIRRIDITKGIVQTIAGMAGESGHRDGEGRKALFNMPTSLGVDPITGLVFVLDNRETVRMLNITETGVQVDTLVGGACRVIETTTSYETILSRTVRCQTGWTASSPGSSDAVSRWAWPVTCLGNSVTCSNRYDEL